MIIHIHQIIKCVFETETESFAKNNDKVTDKDNIINISGFDESLHTNSNRKNNIILFDQTLQWI